VANSERYVLESQVYTPIACGLHDNYQLAAMRRAPLDLRWMTEAGEFNTARLTILDVCTHDGGEYLYAESSSGEPHKIRLDRICQANWAVTGEPLDQKGL
jgi:transcriptional antiterminator Rof (Rho-off)